MNIAPAAAPSGVGVTTASPAESTGVATAESPTATAAEEKPKSTLERMKALLGRRKEAVQAPAKDESPAPADTVGPGDVKAEAEVVETVPMSAFKERIGRLTEQKRELAQKVQAASLEVQRREAALEILIGENQRLQQALRDGTRFDERDDVIRQHEIAELARQRAAEIRDAAEQAAREAYASERQAELNHSVREEVGSALAAHPLIHRAELVAACKLDENISRSATEVAADLEAQKLEIARARLGTERPRAPTTVRATSGGNGAYSYPNNPKGMAALLAASRQAAQ